MKTPIQQLIRTLNELSEPRVSDSLEQEEYKGGLRVAAAYAKQMLDKEKEFIQEVYWEGGQEVPQHWSTVDDWYNKTFNAKEK